MIKVQCWFRTCAKARVSTQYLLLSNCYLQPALLCLLCLLHIYSVLPSFVARVLNQYAFPGPVFIQYEFHFSSIGIFMSVIKGSKISVCYIILHVEVLFHEKIVPNNINETPGGVKLIEEVEGKTSLQACKWGELSSQGHHGKSNSRVLTDSPEHEPPTLGMRLSWL